MNIDLFSTRMEHFFISTNHSFEGIISLRAIDICSTKNVAETSFCNFVGYGHGEPVFELDCLRGMENFEKVLVEGLKDFEYLV